MSVAIGFLNSIAYSSYLRLNNHIQRGSGWCRPHRHWAQRPREVKERIGLSHIGCMQDKVCLSGRGETDAVMGCLVERSVGFFYPFGCGGGVAQWLPSFRRTLACLWCS